MDLHQLPKVRDSLSFLYLEHVAIEKMDNGVTASNKEGRTHVPIASLCSLLLGPGTTVTHGAIKVIAESGCSVIWSGEEGCRVYAQGMGETRKARHLLEQAMAWADPERHIAVVRAMYEARFTDAPPHDLTLNQLRGYEGRRVRDAYQELATRFKIPWSGRDYSKGSWDSATPINRAISTANAVLNGICHAAIISGGYSPGLGFIHTGKQLSFVYDIADLYKAEITLPLAFQVVAESLDRVEARVRARCRETMKITRLLHRILPDIDGILGISSEVESQKDDQEEPDERLWDTDGEVKGGHSHGRDDI